MVAFHTITVTPVASSLGARIEGIDLAAPLDPLQLDELHRALLDHLVVFLPHQKIDDDAQIGLGEHIRRATPPPRQRVHG